ncbi:DinB family protein [Chungangia koreensis]|uniref:DinB family protein n=1 Tax=Chungangia koreensis TaxID=752657 RepID=A0ABV8X4M6_9LACT
MTKQEILIHQQDYLFWLESLKAMPEETATKPFLEGKWSPKEILMHMAEWDRYTREERLPLMKEGGELEDIPFEPFNESAAAEGRKLIFVEVIRHAKEERQKIKDQLQAIEEVDWTKEFKIGDYPMTILQYFADFVWHDNHHKEQIESVRHTSV